MTGGACLCVSDSNDMPEPLPDAPMPVNDREAPVLTVLLPALLGATADGAEGMGRAAVRASLLQPTGPNHNRVQSILGVWRT